MDLECAVLLSLASLLKWDGLLVWVSRQCLSSDLGLGQGGLGGHRQRTKCALYLSKGKTKHKQGNLGHAQARIKAAERGAQELVDEHKNFIFSSLSSACLLGLGLSYYRLIEV